MAGRNPDPDSPTGIPAVTRLLCGPQDSGRAAAIDALIRRHWGRAALLVPTQKCAQRRLEDLVLAADLPGLWGRTVLTFEDFVAELLRAEGRPPVRLGDFERGLLLQAALERLRGKPSIETLGDAAETRGFASQMLRIVNELKQAAVDPAQFRRCIAAARNPNWLDPVVADVYEAYQDTLLEAGVYDVPGMFWEASVICRDRRPRGIRDIEILLLDGFDDFTPSEFDLLTSLRPHLAELVFGLNCDTAPNRSDVYAAPLRTARRIEREFGAVIENFEPPAPRTFTQYAAASIFWRDKPPPLPDSLRRDLEILPCADPVQEIETIGRRIKQLLLDGTFPGEIAVVYPSLAGPAAAIRSVFAEFGVPVHVLHSPRLWESSIAAFVLALLEAIDDWQRDSVVDVLTSPWFLPGRPHLDAIPTLARAASIISGREEWRRRIEALAARLDRDVPELAGLQRIPATRDALDALTKAVGALCAHDDAFPAQATATGFIDALERLLTDLGIEAAARACTIDETRICETAALDALSRVLDTWRAWDRGPAISRAAFAAEFRQAMQNADFSPPQPRDAVLCMEAGGIRHLQFDYVFFAGVNEGQIPGPPRINAVYSEQDLANLARTGIELEGRYAHIEREILRFHHVLGAARKLLVVSWQRLSPRGNEGYPSPYIADLLELFPGEALEPPLPQSNQFVPPLDAAASWRDIRNAAFLASMGAPPELRAKFPAIELAARIETARHDFSPFGIYDGVLANPQVLDGLAREFGEQHLFSVNQLETYAECPFHFFIERVLGMDEIEAPAEEFDSIVRGNILHEVLHKFHLGFHLLPVCAIPEDEAVAALDTLIADAFEKYGWRSINAPPAVVNVEKRYARNLLLRYLYNERETDETPWQPMHFEAAFGKAYGETASPITVAQPYRLQLEDGAVLFSGRIDRIDVHADEANFARIVDYKTSKIPEAKAVKEGRSLQLAVYALALEELLMPGTTCDEALFLSIGKKDRRRLSRDDTCGRREDVCATIANYVAGLRAGIYPPAPADPKSACAYCSAQRTCRYETGRIDRKGPPS